MVMQNGHKGEFMEYIKRAIEDIVKESANNLKKLFQ